MDQKENTSGNMSQNNPPQAKSTVVESLYDWLDTFVFALVIVTVLFTFVVRQVQVDGESMMNTLQDGNRLLINNIGYEPEQGDIVVVQVNDIRDDKPIIKRVIATEGQTVDIDFESWTVSVDGKPLNESEYIDVIKNVSMYNPGGISYPYTLKDNEVFVMGDNRNNSRDSRFCGAIDKKYILGKAFIRLFPFDEIGLF